MQVKKSTLYIICPIFITILTCGYIAYVNYEKKTAEERDKAELRASFEKDCEREYQSLLNEYEFIIKTIKDNSYSDRFRYKYVIKLNDLLGFRRYKVGTFTEYEAVRDCISDLHLNEEKDKNTLKQKAYQKVYNEWFK